MTSTESSGYGETSSHLSIDLKARNAIHIEANTRMSRGDVFYIFVTRPDHIHSPLACQKPTCRFAISGSKTLCLNPCRRCWALGRTTSPTNLQPHTGHLTRTVLLQFSSVIPATGLRSPKSPFCANLAASVAAAMRYPGDLVHVDEVRNKR